eukprot:8010038-Ditylum_brightwellii.AAC.1
METDPQVKEEGSQLVSHDNGEKPEEEEGFDFETFDLPPEPTFGPVPHILPMTDKGDLDKFEEEVEPIILPPMTTPVELVLKKTDCTGQDPKVLHKLREAAEEGHMEKFDIF